MPAQTYIVAARFRLTTERFSISSAREALEKAEDLMEAGAGVTITTAAGEPVSLPELAETTSEKS